MADVDDGWADATWEGADRRQRRLGLTLTVAERFRWLEETLAWIHQVHELNGVGTHARADQNEAPTLYSPGIDSTIPEPIQGKSSQDIG